MDYYNIFIKAFEKEISKFNLDPTVCSTYMTTLTSTLDVNFDIPYSRCAYLFRYAVATTYFVNTCMKQFFSGYSKIQDVLSTWKSYSAVNICSLSQGPGVDYLGFVLAMLEEDVSLPNFDVTIVTKHGAWRNTVNSILELLNKQETTLYNLFSDVKYENVKVVQADILNSYSKNVEIVAIKEANVILMIKSLNLTAPGNPKEGILMHTYKALISSLKPETIIVFIDTKPSLSLLTPILSSFPGSFLHGPIHHSVQLPSNFPELYGTFPVLSARGVFFVWKKSLDSGLCAISPTPKNPISDVEKEINTLAVEIIPEKCYTPANEDKVEVKGTDTNSFNPWRELKSHLTPQSPRAKEPTKDIDHVNLQSSLDNLISMYDKCFIDDKNTLKSVEAVALTDVKLPNEQIPAQVLETTKLEETKIIYHPRNLCVNNLKAMPNNSMPTTLPYKSKELPSSLGSKESQVNSQPINVCLNYCDTLPQDCNMRSMSPSSSEGAPSLSLTNTHSSASSFYSSKAGAIPKHTKTNKDALMKKAASKIQSVESKVIQTDTIQGVSGSSLKELTERIKGLAVSLTSVSDRIACSSSAGGDFFDLQGSCKKSNDCCCLTNKHSRNQSPNSCSKHSFSTCEGTNHFSNRNCHSIGHHYSCNRCIHCIVEPCCSSVIAGCSSMCSVQQPVRKNNSENFNSSNTLVIPLKDISEQKLLQIISILKPESID